MELSVIVSTLNDRESLVACLDVLAEHPRSTETIVVNGPSSDGTSGYVRDRDDVDVLVEISERNPNVSRNAGLEFATKPVIAFLNGGYVPEPGWYDAIRSTVAADHDVVTGPVAHRSGRKPLAQEFGSQFNVGNAAFDAAVLERLDGFDEYLSNGRPRDCADRLEALGTSIVWCPKLSVQSQLETDGGRPEWGERYRALSYRRVKNDGPRPTVLGRIGYEAAHDGVVGVRSILTGETTPTGWFDDGISVVKSLCRGILDGTRARYADRTERRNPHGVSNRHDRAVQVYDRRPDENR